MSPASGPEWTDIIAVPIATISVVIAILAWLAARIQANMAQSQAADAQRAADAAKEQVALGKDQLDVALRQLELEQQVRREQQEPYIVVDIQPSAFVNSVLLIVIENTGPTVARNVRIKFSPEIERFMDTDGFGRFVLAESFLFKNGIPSMPPGRRIELLFDLGFKRLNSDLPKEYTVTVDCDGPGDRPVETMVYKIDLRIYEGTEQLGVRNIHDGVKMLEKVKDELSGIRKLLPGPRG
ncbi:hypothetical protein Ppa06_26280 [Planomonospora parontospora subsp. parontospora]|uniref:Uncharacterized protein n=2 Tax=Planomonospora parontospora TaxID=58119 RepID=A0AA37F3V9_9ACTN|nr:hypothetical protein [Planomonospora parontospora]GGK59978.1 hypothetical protein GCM10010126_19400 [Planomonospora parontospora]GII08830.1 hypothetical protein Ppa06_26280 [Planomonospora parontospora subsp. parontospora]